MNGQVTIVDQLKWLLLVLAEITLNNFFDSSVYFAQINFVSVEINLRFLNFAQNLNEKWLSIHHHNFEMLFDSLFGDAIDHYTDLNMLIRL